MFYCAKQTSLWAMQINCRGGKSFKQHYISYTYECHQAINEVIFMWGCRRGGGERQASTPADRNAAYKLGHLPIASKKATCTFNSRSSNRSTCPKYTNVPLAHDTPLSSLLTLSPLSASVSIWLRPYNNFNLINWAGNAAGSSMPQFCKLACNQRQRQRER